MSNTCKHNDSKQTCYICELEEERDRYKQGLEEICLMDTNTNKPVLDHWGMIALAKFVLDLDNKYLIRDLKK